MPDSHSMLGTKSALFLLNGHEKVTRQAIYRCMIPSMSYPIQPVDVIEMHSPLLFSVVQFTHELVSTVSTYAWYVSYNRFIWKVEDCIFWLSNVYRHIVYPTKFRCTIQSRHRTSYPGIKDTVVVKLSCHGVGFVLAGGTVSCHNDNFGCRYWRQGWHCDSSRFPMLVNLDKCLIVSFKPNSLWGIDLQYTSDISRYLLSKEYRKASMARPCS